jgi:glyoxylase-like metal-dependent hydrolase (beta-lactamase superfamily II)
MNYPQRVSERIYILGTRHFLSYLIKGDRITVLIEPGISSTAKQIPDQIISLGLDPSRIEKLVLTHAHADHVTGATVLKKALPQIRVSASVDTGRLLEKEKIRDLFIKDDQDISRRLNIIEDAGEPESMLTALTKLVDETIHPGQILDLGGVTLEIIDAPGHCLGGLAFWEPGQEVLFCSDYLGFLVPDDRFVPNFYVNFLDFMTTFDSLAELHPSWICPGHCGAHSCKDATRYIHRSRAEMEWIYHRVLEYDAAQDSMNETLQKELFERYFIGEATMFSEQSTRYCIQLLIRRIIESKDSGDFHPRAEQ